MARLVVQMQTTVDGFVESDAAEWSVWDWSGASTWDAQLLAAFNSAFDDVSTILLSRPLIEGGYLDHWTETAEARAGDPDFRFAERIVSVDKTVISRSLTSSRWPRTTVETGGVADVLPRLKQRAGGDIIAFGGVTFARSLLAAGLVDELQLYVNPMAVGRGRALFTEATALSLLESKAYECGIVVNRYTPASNEPVVRHDLRPAVDQLVDVVARVRTEQLARPTPCAAYDVAALLDHLMSLTRVFTLAAQKVDDPAELADESVPGQASAEHLHPRWRELLPDRLAALADAWALVDAWQGRTNAGMPMDAPMAGTVALDEIILHGWDLARAIDQTFVPQPEHVDVVQEFVTSTDRPKSKIPRAALFGDARPVRDDDTTWRKTLALAGRDPDWPTTSA